MATEAYGNAAEYSPRAERSGIDNREPSRASSPLPIVFHLLPRLLNSDQAEDGGEGEAARLECGRKPAAREGAATGEAACERRSEGQLMEGERGTSQRSDRWSSAEPRRGAGAASERRRMKQQQQSSEREHARGRVDSALCATNQQPPQSAQAHLHRPPPAVDSAAADSADTAAVDRGVGR